MLASCARCFEPLINGRCERCGHREGNVLRVRTNLYFATLILSNLLVAILCLAFLSARAVFQGIEEAIGLPGSIVHTYHLETAAFLFCALGAVAWHARRRSRL